jgi:hypothetical protein
VALRPEADIPTFDAGQCRPLLLWKDLNLAIQVSNFDQTATAKEPTLAFGPGQEIAHVDYRRVD